MSENRPIIGVVRPQDPDHPLPTPPGLAALEDRAEIRFTDADQLREDIAAYHALFLWDFFSDAVQGAWPAAESLEWIHVAAAGVDTLLFEDLAASEVTVTNAQGTFDRPIAEWVLGAMLAHAKDFAAGYRYQQQKRWVHRETLRVQDSTALIIGTGAIGREIARLLKALGVQVRGAGRTTRDDDADFGTVLDSGQLPEHIGWADTIINAAPLTAATTGLINRDALEAAKSTAHLINIGRGQTVDEPALVDGLEAGEIGFASLDVFATEPLPEESPLWEMDNVLISAHMSGDAQGWRHRLAEQFVDNAERWLKGQPLTNVVDKAKGYVPRH